MCPLMSAVATILFKGGLFQAEFVAKWLQTTALNYPMATFTQLFIAGPLVRRIFRAIFSEKRVLASRTTLVVNTKEDLRAGNQS